MTLILLGINHKTAPIELRERVAIPREMLAVAAQSLAGLDGVSEAMILSTCNRVEILTAADSRGVDLAQFLHRHLGLDLALLRPHVYEYRDRDAVRHLFRVAASLDSMVVGEPQILGQVKDAYSVAREAGTISSELDSLLQSAFAAAKKVRTETEIGSNTVSIASVAVDLAQKVFGSLAGKKVFLVGAGEMSELAARHLVRQGAGTILVANRTLSRAERMAEQFTGPVAPQVIPWERLWDVASQADIVITSTGAPQPIFRREHGQAFLQKRKNKPMFFIDIAVPRDVDPEINRLEGIFLYDIDDLEQVAAAHLAERSKEAAEAEALIAVEVERYQERLKSVQIGPLIAAMQVRAEEMRQAELRRMQTRLGQQDAGSLSAGQAAAVEAMSRGLVNKLLHPAMLALKQAARDGDMARIEEIKSAWALEAMAKLAAGGGSDERGSLLEAAEDAGAAEPAQEMQATLAAGARKGAF
jgi:glutamyl-tRNA reductase